VRSRRAGSVGARLSTRRDGRGQHFVHDPPAQRVDLSGITSIEIGDPRLIAAHGAARPNAVDRNGKSDARRARTTAGNRHEVAAPGASNAQAAGATCARAA
jgi:hypothetical protein